MKARPELRPSINDRIARIRKRLGLRDDQAPKDGVPFRVFMPRSTSIGKASNATIKRS
ncbi:MAG: hypothetical protein AAGH89_04130 [Verrucomicrobiota bacterium]